MVKLSQDFYARPDVMQISKELLGKLLFTRINGKVSAGIITETEAYAGVDDKASHAYGNRRTNRTETMYSEGGQSYVYLCYGIHSLFNVVTNRAEIPHAVLIRAIKPITGIEYILKRRNSRKLNRNLTVGPGKVCSALGLNFKEHNNLSLQGNTVWIKDDGISFIENDITIGPRVGVDYAGEDAQLPYRFQVHI